MTFKFYALKLCAICSLIYAAQIFITGFTDLFVLNSEAFTEPWRFLSAVFLHGSFVHLLYNLFALALFGSMLERLIGGKRFLIVFFITGILANFVAVNYYPASLGASGAIFGVIGALIIVRPLLVIWAFGMPMPIFMAGIIWVVGDIIGTFIPSDVGTIAHLAGIFFGFLLGALFRKKVPSKYRSPKLKLDEGTMRQWEDGYLR